MTTKFHWDNMRTGEIDHIDTPTDFTDYIPQTAAALNLYNMLLTAGKTPLDAAIEVLFLATKKA